MKTAAMTIVIILFVLVLLGFIGLQIKPAPLAPLASQPKDLGSMPISSDLPLPVARFYERIYGSQIPILETAVLTGRAELVFMGITFPSRFRFTHVAGYDYHHRIESTLFGIPIMKVDESYISGYARMVLPVGTFEGEPKLNQAANLTLWAEALYFPAVFLTDDRVEWEAVDENTAFLHVPFEENRETFVVEFDEETGLVSSLEIMRYKEADSPEKTRWTIDAIEWDEVNGQQVPRIASITWGDMEKPWAVFDIEQVDLNTDTSFAISH